MLTCRWCGLRPTEEFASLEEVREDVACGFPADGAAEAEGEWWWHRLGCGRPFVVRLTTAPHRAALPDDDRATRATAVLAVEVEDVEVQDVEVVDAEDLVGVDPTAEGSVDAAAPARVRAVEETDSSEIDALVDSDPMAVPDAGTTVIDLTELDAVAVAGITVDLVGEPPVDYERPIGAPGRAEALTEAAEAQGAPGGEAPFSFNLLVQASPPPAAAEDDEDDEDDEGTGWGEEDSAGDRFRPGARRDGAQELSRRTIRPMPARSVGGRVPQKVQVARRPAIIYGARSGEGAAPGGAVRGNEAVPLATGDQGSSGPAPTDRVEAESARLEAPDGPTPAGRGDVSEGARSTSLFARIGSGATAGSAPASTEPASTQPVSDASFAGALHDVLAEPPPPRPTPSPAARRSGLFEVPPASGDEAGE